MISPAQRQQRNGRDCTAEGKTQPLMTKVRSDRIVLMKKRGSVLNTVLASLVATLVVCIVAGTVYAFVSGRAQPGVSLRKSDPEPEQILRSRGSAAGVYPGIGEIRAATADDPPVPVVVTPYFEYPADDTALYEEIVQKSRKIRSIIVSFFGAKTRQELIDQGEVRLKAELLEEINAEFVLGTLHAIYFEEFMFFE